MSLMNLLERKMKTHNVLAVFAAVIATAPPIDAKTMSQAKIKIDAPIEKVWALVIGVDRWPQWNHAVQTAHLEGPFKHGAVFNWTSGGFAIRSTVQDVEPMRRLVWTGKTLGTSAVHSWRFEVADEGVVVTTSESFDGWLPTIMPRTMQRKLDETLPALLESLKAAAERR